MKLLSAYNALIESCGSGIERADAYEAGIGFSGFRSGCVLTVGRLTVVVTSHTTTTTGTPVGVL